MSVAHGDQDRLLAEPLYRVRIPVPPRPWHGSRAPTGSDPSAPRRESCNTVAS